MNEFVGMRFGKKDDPASEHGAVVGSRAVLIIAICFLVLCLAQAAATIVWGQSTAAAFDRAYHEATFR